MSLGVGVATKTPRLGSRAASRSAMSRANASRIVLREKPRAAPIVSSVSRVPERSAPLTICSRRASATRSAAEGWADTWAGMWRRASERTRLGTAAL